jgi:hypothetical protein
VFNAANLKTTEQLLEEYATGGTYGPEHPIVQMVIQHRLQTRLAELTGNLAEASTKIYEEVARLANSSEKLESLTKRLNRLTWVLIGLTALAVVTPIGIEAWKAHQESQPAHVSAQLQP